MPTTLHLTTTENQPVEEIRLPSSWTDVTLGEYLAILAPQDVGSFEPRLTHLTAAQLAQLEKGDRLRLMQRLNFVLDSQQPEEQLATPGLYEIDWQLRSRPLRAGSQAALDFLQRSDH